MRARAIAGQPRLWAGVGASNVRSNHARVTGENTLSASTPSSVLTPIGFTDSPRYLAPMSFDERLTRRGSLARLGTLLAAAAGGGMTAAEAAGEMAPPRCRPALVTCVLTPELTEGRTTSPARRFAATSPTAVRERRSRFTCPWSTRRPASRSRVRRSTSGMPTPAASTPGSAKAPRAGRSCAGSSPRTPTGWRASHRLSGVVHGPSRPHPRQGARRRQRRAHRPVLLQDSLTDTVYKRAPYSSRPNRDTRNAHDSIFVNGGKRSILAVKRSGAG